MSLLSVIQDFCRLHAFAVPTAVIGSNDTQVNQLYGILKEICEEMVQESKFNVTNQEATLALTAAYDQGPMTTICPSGYQFAIFETFFDRTLRRPLAGPISESEWQNLMALPTAGTWYKFRIKQDHLWIYPLPVAPFSTIAFEYASSWYTKSAAGVLKSAPDTDTDTFLFPERIIRKGVSFRFKQIKGLPYQEDEKQYYNLLNNYIARDKVKRRINLAEPEPQDLRPGILVPSNTWNVH